MTQPMPTPGERAVGPQAVMRLSSLILQRTHQGVKTYGTPLQTFNGRDALQDCLEEIIDALLYLIQAMMEREAQGESWDEALMNLRDDEDERFDYDVGG